MRRKNSGIRGHSFGVKITVFWQLFFAKILGGCQNRTLSFCTHLRPKIGVGIHYIQNEKVISNFRNSFWKPRFSYPISDFGYHPDPEAPPLVVPRGGTTSRGALMSDSTFSQSHRSPMPLSKFRKPSAAPWSLLRGLVGGAVVLVAGPLLEPSVPPLVQLRAAPGPWCGASVGTTGSAPCAVASTSVNVKKNTIFGGLLGAGWRPLQDKEPNFLLKKHYQKTWKNMQFWAPRTVKQQEFRAQSARNYRTKVLSKRLKHWEFPFRKRPHFLNGNSQYWKRFDKLFRKGIPRNTKRNYRRYKVYECNLIQLFIIFLDTKNDSLFDQFDRQKWSTFWGKKYVPLLKIFMFFEFLRFLKNDIEGLKNCSDFSCVLFQKSVRFTCELNFQSGLCNIKWTTLHATPQPPVKF